MRVGSIVVCLFASHQGSPFIKWLPTMDQKTPYMLRQVDEERKLVSFEEGIIGIAPDGNEIGFPIDKVREILPPEDISKQIEEMISVTI